MTESLILTDSPKILRNLMLGGMYYLSPPDPCLNVMTQFEFNSDVGKQISSCQNVQIYQLYF